MSNEENPSKQFTLKVDEVTPFHKKIGRFLKKWFIEILAFVVSVNIIIWVNRDSWCFCAPLEQIKASVGDNDYLCTEINPSSCECESQKMVNIFL